MKRNMTIPLAALVLTVVAAQSNAQITAPFVVDQVRNLRTKGDVLGSNLIPELPSLAIGYHYQGFARHPDPKTPVLYATFNFPCDLPGYSGGAGLAIIHLGWADVNESWRLRSNRLSAIGQDSTAPRACDTMVNVIRFPTLFHASGIQTYGKYLAMSVTGDDGGCAGSSFIKIYDISDPYNPVEYSEAYSGGAGAVGFTQLSDGRYLLVTDLNGGVKFLLSSGSTPSNFSYYSWNTAELTSEDPDHPVVSWPHSGAGGGGTYEPQSFGLVLGTDYAGSPSTESLYLLSFRNTSPVGAEVDRIDVYGVDLFDSGGIRVWQVLERDFPYDSTGNFSAGSSLWVAPDGELIVYKCPHYNSGPLATLQFVEHSSYKGKDNGIAADGDCLAHVQLYTSINRNDSSVIDYSIGVDAVDVLYEDYSFLGNVDPIGLMNESISSVAWTLPEGCTCRLYEHPDFNPAGGHYLDLVGTGTTQEHLDLGDVLWTNASGDGRANNQISSLRFIGNCPGRGYYTDPGDWLNNIYVPLLGLAPSNVCTVLKMNTGNYTVSGLATIDRPATLHAVGGLVTIGP